MNGNRYYGVRVEGAKYGVGFGSALAIAISYTNNHSILWAIIHGILGWLYVIYVALFALIAAQDRPHDRDLHPVAGRLRPCRQQRRGISHADARHRRHCGADHAV